MERQQDCGTRWILQERMRAQMRIYTEAAAALRDVSALDGAESSGAQEVVERAERARLAFEHAQQELQQYVESHSR